jgi:hypothetical protein
MREKESNMGTAMDLTDAEVKKRLGSYSDAAITAELYDFGKMLLQDAIDRFNKLDSKASALAAYCGGLITVLVSTHGLWSKLQNAQVDLIQAATGLLFLSAAFAVLSMFLRGTQWFSQNEWLKADCLSSADRLRRYHVLTMWGVVRSHHAAYRRKLLTIYATQFLLIAAVVVLLVALL